MYGKVVKNKAYFKRFQVKYRRRREGKTDYYARRRLVLNDKTKYGTPKYRFVVRFTNKDCVCQIVSSTIKGDQVHAAAYSHELPRYGLTVGLKNYAAGYCTGLLLARRWLQSIKLGEKFSGADEVTGEYFNCGDDYDKKENGSDAVRALGRAPFKCYLDVGLARTTRGSRVFSCLKGAVDGGLNVPHSEDRFVGFNADSEELDASAFRHVIFGGHIADYMDLLENGDEEREIEPNPEAFQRQFSKYIENGITGESLEELYQKVHENIRADPSRASEEKKSVQGKSYATPKRSYIQRKNRVKQILAARAAAM